MGSASIKPIQRVATPSLLADQLRQAIMDGTLTPGSQLAESELAGQFGVSRGPLREATQRLVQEGLLINERHRGLFVVTLTSEDIRDVYTARMAVEGAAAQRILERDPEGAADRLTLAQDRMVTAAEAGDLEALAAADLEFHERFVDESGSPRLRRMTGTLLVETRMCMTALQDHYAAPHELADEHRALIEALRERDEQRLQHLISVHMSDAIDRLAPNGTGEDTDEEEPAG